MLCLGTILESLPPQCGDVRIANWDWDRIKGEERLSGTTWGRYHVMGTLDGKAFIVTDVDPRRRKTLPLVATRSARPARSRRAAGVRARGPGRDRTG